MTSRNEKGLPGMKPHLGDQEGARREAGLHSAVGEAL